MNITNIAFPIEPCDKLISNLRQLMRAKNINEAELARLTGVPQPTLHKILTGKTLDPRASTLKSLADYFDISIDQLLNDMVCIANPPAVHSIPIISWTDCTDPSFSQGLRPNSWVKWIVSDFISKYTYALLSKPSFEPRFPLGTILVVDPSTPAEDGDMVVVHFANTAEATMRRFVTDGPATLLLPVVPTSPPTIYGPGTQILGVLIKSIYSY